jgi:CRP/FNR family transcriptional regulator/CRP/FNR family cyclic AMP-dependent transcriptional regulator
MTPDEFRQRFPAFTAISDDDLGALLGVLKIKEIQKGSDIIPPNSENRNLYLIQDGRLRVSLDSGDGCTVLGDFGPGQWLGEMGMIEPDPVASVATVTAVEDSVLLQLSHPDFMALRRTNVSLTSVVLQVFCAALSERLRSTMRLVYDGESTSDAAGEPTSGWFVEVARQLMGIAARTGT